MDITPGFHAFVPHPLTTEPPSAGLHPSTRTQGASASRRVVVLAAPGADAEAAAWRAALIARDQRVGVHLLARAMDDRWLELATEELQDMADRLHAHFSLPITLGLHHSRLGEEDPRASDDRSLAVMAAPQGLLTERLFGSAQERLARRGGTPVLLVRRPPMASYRRVIAAVHSQQDALPVLQAAGQLSRDPRMTVLHVVEPHRQDLPRDTQPDTADAMQHLAALITNAGLDCDAARPVLRSGEAGREILQQATAEQAQLLVLGVRPRPRWREWVPGLLRRVLHGTAADVLLVRAGPTHAEGSA